MTHESMNCDTYTELLGAMLEGDLDPSQRAALEAHEAHCAGCAALRSDLERISAEASRLPVLAPSRDLWEGIAERIDAKVLPLAAPAAATAGSVSRAARPRWMRQSLLAAALVLVTASVTWFATKQAHERSTARQVAATSPAQGDSSALPIDAAGGAPGGTSMIASGPRDGTKPAVQSPTSELVGGQELQVAFSDPKRPAGQAGPTGERRSADGSQRPRPSSTGERRTSAGGTAMLASDVPEAAQAVEAVYGSEIQRLHDIVAQRKSELDPATVKVIEDNLAIIDSAIVQSRRAIARDPNSGFLMDQLNSVLDRKVGLLRTAAMLPARS